MLAAIVWTASGAALAANGAGTAGGLLARLPFGARVLALGGPQGGLPDSPGSMLANPAALGVAGPAAFEAGYHQGVDEVRHGGIAGAGEVLPWLSAGAAVQTLDAGVIETYDLTGAKYSADLEDDRLVVAGAAARLGQVCLGASVKYLGSTLLGTKQSTALLADLGMRLRIDMDPPDWYREDQTRDPDPNWLALSFAVGNLGSRFDYGGASDAAPTVWRLGAVMGRAVTGTTRILIAFAADVPRATASPEGRSGLEFVWPIATIEVAGRIGARLVRDGGVLAGGLGLSIRGISVDYACVSGIGPFDATHNVTLGFNLGSFRKRIPKETE